MLRAGRDREPDEKQHDSGEPTDRQHDQSEPSCNSGNGESMSIRDPSTRLIDAVRREHAEARDLDLEDEQEQAEDQERETGSN